MDSRKPQHRRFSLVAASVAIVLVAAAAAFLALGRADPAPAAAPPPALAPSALPYLPSKTLVLTSKDLEADAHIQSLSSELSSTGFVVGFQRTFQGPSKHRLELVQSRTLRFATAAGAARFAAFVGKHAGDYVGQIPTVTTAHLGRAHGLADRGPDVRLPHVRAHPARGGQQRAQRDVARDQRPGRGQAGAGRPAATGSLTAAIMTRNEGAASFASAWMLLVPGEGSL